MDRIPTVLTREKALNLAVWFVVLSDSKTDSGASDFALMLKGVLNR
jgi:hypothetical protein